MADEVRMIDADALKVILNKVEEECERDWFKGNEFREMIDITPTIEAEPVKYGEWEYEDTIGGMKDYRCTNCKCIADENQILWWKFCPNCGCKLDLEGNSND